MEQNREYYVKIDANLADRVKDLAKRERRTIKAEFEMVLEAGLEAFEREHGTNGAA